MRKNNGASSPAVSETKAFWLRIWAKRHSPTGDLVRALLCVVIGLLIGLWLIGVASDYLGIMKDETEHEVTVQAGWTTLRMAHEMKKQGVINHPFMFTLYSMMKDADEKFKSGTYLLDGGMTYDKIISTVQRRQKNQTVRITFTEGMTAHDIADLLEKNGVCTAGEFLNAVNTGEFNYDFVPYDTEYNGRFYRLEGYLFPDTYDFYINENVSSVVRKFLNNFNTKFTENMRRRAEELGMTIDQVVTLASIIEKEAPDVFEKANVSGVLHNRLRDPARYPKLQSDATAYYVSGVIYKALDIRDEIYQAAYDTYFRTGLPVGAICNPGGASLTAALNPSESGDYYFVTDKEGNFYYASTLNQHNANIREASRNGGIGGTYTHD